MNPLRLLLGSLFLAVLAACGPTPTPGECGASPCPGTDAGQEDAGTADGGGGDEDGGGVDGGEDGGATDGGEDGGTGLGDSCAQPEEIVLSTSGYGVASGSTAGMADDAAGSCGGSGGGDTVFRFTTATPGTLAVDVRPVDSSLAPVLYVRSACDTQNSQPPAGCVSAPQAGGSTLLTLQALPAGTYFLWVDSGAGTGGGFTVTLTLSSTIQGEACSAPIPLTFTGGEASAVGTTSGMVNDTSGSCGGSAGADTVYRFTTQKTLNLDATVTGSANMRPVTYLQSSCGSTTLACHAAATNGDPARVRAGSLPAGTYYLWVDAASATAGEFALHARLWDPEQGDTCADPAPLSLSAVDGGYTAALSTSTSGLFHDVTTICGGSSGPDRVYSFTTSAEFDLTATVTAKSAGFEPVIALRSSCATSELTCKDGPAGGSASIRSSSLSPGTYYLWVDGLNGTSGDFDLDVDLADVAPGDTCNNPAPLSLTANGAGFTATENGSTASLFGNSAGTCGGSGPDQVYTFTTSGTFNLQATLTASGSLQPVLYLRTSCAGGAQLACDDGTAGGTASLTVPSLPAGTYYLWVDGLSSSSGAFSLAVNLDPPVQGDACEAPKPLSFSAAGGGTFTASDTGNTSGLFNQNAGTCGGTAGPDAVYSFTLSAPLKLTASASTTTSTYEPVLYLREGVCTSGSIYGCAVGTAGGTANLSTGTLPVGTYYLWVDGLNGTAGDYALSATLAP